MVNDGSQVQRVRRAVVETGGTPNSIIPSRHVIGVSGRLMNQLDGVWIEYDDGGDIVNVQIVSRPVIPGWELRLTLTPGDDENDISSITITRTGDTGTAGKNLVRKLGWGHVLNEARRILSSQKAQRALGPTWTQEVARPGRAGREDVFYALWADRYVRALTKDPRRPVKVICDEAAAAGEYLTGQQVRGYLTEARSKRRDLLTPAPPGKPGGKLTARAKKLLAEVE